MNCCQRICRNKQEMKCVVNGYGTHCYTLDKTRYRNECACCNMNCVKEYRCGKLCSTRCYRPCADDCNNMCLDKYKWAPKRVFEEKKTCDVNVRFGWRKKKLSCKVKEETCSSSSSCSSSASCSSSSSCSDSSSSRSITPQKKKWCCKACKRKYEKRK